MSTNLIYIKIQSPSVIPRFESSRDSYSLPHSTTRTLPRVNTKADWCGFSLCTCIDRKDGHEENNISATEKDAENLGRLLVLFQLCLSDDHSKGGDQHDGAVARVAKHDGEQKGKGGDGEGRGVHLAVGVHAVRINKVLK